VADVPVPGAELSDVGGGDASAAGSFPVDRIPSDVRSILETLWRAGHAAYAVGGGPRDLLLGRESQDWDLATAALPEQTAAIFGAVYENRFGTVAVRQGEREVEITTFRSDHDYADFRRPHRVEFTGSIEADLGRRDFTVNALAWGAESATQTPRLVDLHDGRSDLAARLIRAVGDPRERFEEDALRIVRAIRFATTLGFTIEPATLAAIRDTAPLVAHLSGERIAMELGRILAAERPSVGLRLLADTGVLAAISPALAAQRGIEQNKIPGEDLWDHTLRTVDAAANEPVLRMAALLHDLGKPATAADGHFYRHEGVGAELAEAFLDRLHAPKSLAEPVVHLVRQHMFRYEPNWSDSAIRRFLGKVRPEAVDDLFALREADNVGSGVAADADDLPVLRSRIAAELASGPLLDRSGLAVDGSDLIAELGLSEGPELGRLIDALFERVVEDPRLNDRSQLIGLARDLLGGGDPPA
jgi:putative nucleotidyltransferase with HDIG domain